MSVRVAAVALALSAACGLRSAEPPTKHTDNVYAVALAPGGGRFASASEDNTALVWDAAGPTARLVLEHAHPVYDLAYSPNGKTIVTADGGGTVSVWDATTGKERARNNFPEL